MRRILVTAVLLVGCRTSSKDCCDLGDAVARLDAESCATAGGAVVAAYLCKGVDDADVFGDSDGGDPTNEPLPADQAGRCKVFCQFLTALCPTDTACEESCNHSSTPPDQDAVDCAAGAVDCNTAETTCWAFGTWQ